MTPMMEQYFEIKNKYNDLVNVNGNVVSYDSIEYSLHNNTLARVWKHDLTRMSDIVSVIKTAKFSEKENLTVLLNALDEMYLLKDVKNDLLLYAVKELSVLPNDEYNRVEANKENIVFSEEKEILFNAKGEIVDERIRKDFPR